MPLTPEPLRNSHFKKNCAVTQQIGIHKAPLCDLLVLKILCSSTKLTFVLMLSAWCVFNVFHCALSCVSFEFTLGSCVFTLSLHCHWAHGELKMVSNQHIVKSWTHASTNLLAIGIPIIKVKWSPNNVILIVEFLYWWDDIFKLRQIQAVGGRVTGTHSIFPIHVCH